MKVPAREELPLRPVLESRSRGLRAALDDLVKRGGITVAERDRYCERVRTELAEAGVA